MSGGAAADPGRPGGGRLRGALLRFAVLALIVGALAALLLLTPASEYLDREKAAALLGRLRQAWWAPLALIAGYLVIAPSGIPISPLVFAGGAVFGPLWGWVYSTVGCVLSAVLTFGLAHALGRQGFSQFLSTTIIGLVPAVLMWNYIYYALVSAATADERGTLLRNFVVVLVMIALLLLLRPLGQALLKRDRTRTGDSDTP